MLALLRTIPGILVLLIGLGGSGLLFGAWNVLVDNPQIVAVEQARAAAIANAAAEKAKREEQLRQFQIAERATNEFYLEQREDQAWQQAREDLMKMEIADYERELALSGRACLLNQRDIDFLDGLLSQPSGPRSRRR